MVHRQKTILLAIFIVMNLICCAEAKRRKKRKDTEPRGFNTIIKVLIVGIFLPAFVSFGMALYRDPAVPQLLEAALQAAKQRFVSFLGRPEDNDGNQAVRREDRKNV
mmetsp:Transcript_60291/g.82708  ORF Transcript_60291/g.82708 Transcript_60291/m.82708 type:complete len:107 (-) Transcript_60291:322-642(-)